MWCLCTSLAQHASAFWWLSPHRGDQRGSADLADPRALAAQGTVKCCSVDTWAGRWENSWTVKLKGGGYCHDATVLHGVARGLPCSAASSTTRREHTLSGFQMMPN